MQYLRIAIVFGIVSGLGLAPAAYGADECCSGGSCLSESGFPYDADDLCPSGDLCGCTIDGNNCEVTLTANHSTASGDCLTLGDGVTLDMNGKTITCTDDECGIGIKNTNSGAGGSKVIIKNGGVNGCFNASLRATSGENASVEGVNIDGSPDDPNDPCTGGSSISPGWTARVGVVGFIGAISDSEVRDTEIGIMLGQNDAVDCVVAYNDIGMIVSNSSVDITGCMFLENDVHYRPFTSNSTEPDLLESAFVGAGTCNCTNISDVCITDIEDCFVFKGSAPNFVCEPSEDGDRVCSFH